MVSPSESGAGRRDPIREFLAERISSGSMPGASWWIERPEGMLSHGVAGSAVIVPDREPLRDDTPFDLASLTKPLATALLAVLLEGDGTVDPDAPAAAVLPGLRGTPYSAATLTDLASHRAGLPAWRPLYLVASDLDGFVTAIAATASEAAPGTTLYSDLSYLLLGAVLERVSGETLDALFDARVARPLGLRLTGFARRPGRFARSAATENGNRFEREMAGEAGKSFPWRTAIPRGEVHDGNAHALGGVAGHAGLFGTAAEVAAIAREILAPRKLPLTVRGRDRLLVPVAGPSSRTFGFTTSVLSSGARGALPDHAPGHTGFTGTSVWIDPTAGRVYVLLTHRVHPAVPREDFQPVRREFHRLAAALA